jgi:hypothetical protein
MTSLPLKNFEFADMTANPLRAETVASRVY